MIEIANLTKKFGKVTALNNVTLSIKDKGCCALLGFNGAGKSTLINVLTSVLPPTSGTVKINGYDLEKDKNSIKQIVALSPQESAVAKNLTVTENLTLIATLYGLDDVSERVQSTIKQFGLEEKANVLAKRLSGGQIKRLSIALAVIVKPQILFLDEPTLGLDVRARQKLWSIIKQLKEEISVFLTTHYLEEVEALTDEVAIISKGEIKAVGTIENLKAQTGEDSLEKAFLRLTESEE